MRLSLMIEQFENAGSILCKSDFAKRDKNDFMLDPVVITDDEFAASEFRVPEDAMEKVLNRNHDGVTRLQGF